MRVEIPLKRPHKAQQEILDNRKRFNTLKCGRRFGKTELFQVLLSECIKNNWYCAYFCPTYKDLHEVWLETLRIFHPIITSKSETVKQINFIGGGKMDMWSIEDPDSGRGRKYHRVVVDECEKAKKFKTAWEEAIRATLTDYAGDAYLISTPKFGDTYFKHIAKHEQEQPDWKTFVYTTYDNPHIDKNEIEAARRLLPPAVFECEYLAMDVSGRADNVFAYALNEQIHFDQSATMDYSKPLHLSVDFNIIPFSCLASNIWRDQIGLHVNFVGEVAIEKGSVPEMGERLRNIYRTNLHNLVMTGDALGNNRNITQRDNASNYEMIRRIMGLRHSQIIIPANPSHETSRNDFNYLLHISCDPMSRIYVKINPVLCPRFCQELRYTVYDDQKKEIIKSDRTQVAQRADFLDNGRYTVNTFLKKEIQRHLKQNFGKLRLHQ